MVTSTYMFLRYLNAGGKVPRLWRGQGVLLRRQTLLPVVQGRRGLSGRGSEEAAVSMKSLESEEKVEWKRGTGTRSFILKRGDNSGKVTSEIYPQSRPRTRCGRNTRSIHTSCSLRHNLPWRKKHRRSLRHYGFRITHNAFTLQTTFHVRWGILSTHFQKRKKIVIFCQSARWVIRSVAGIPTN